VPGAFFSWRLFFCEYDRVWRYDSSPEYAKRFSVDLFAHAAAAGDYSIIGEVKSRDTRNFSREEGVEFERKFEGVKEQERIERAIGFIFSRGGFTGEMEMRVGKMHLQVRIRGDIQEWHPPEMSNVETRPRIYLVLVLVVSVSEKSRLLGSSH
jgi:hypothetical protein